MYCCSNAAFGSSIAMLLFLRFAKGTNAVGEGL